ncbi:MAG: hypothetical protein D6706_04805 [Chloroflexi bacterium]|nr:MAG: hypothetical protein D6706_04805 [Chloroflexota bacterium]
MSLIRLFNGFLERTGNRRAHNAIWIGGLGVIVLLVVTPLFGMPPKGDDLFLHYYRIPVISVLWQQGVFFSRWVPDLIFGYGSPLFVFYPPLSAYLLTAVYWLVGQNGLVAYNLSYALAFAGSGAGMFMLGRRLFGNAGAMLASAAYLLSPWFLYQSYARGSLSNVWAMTFFPWVVYGVCRVAEEGRGRWVGLTAVFVAGVMLSHVAAGFIFVLALFLFGLLGAGVYLVTGQMGEQNGRYWLVMGAVALGIALSAFSWLPALTEIQVTRYQSEVTKIENNLYFASVWAWPERFVAGATNPPLPQTPGIGQLVFGIMGGVVALAVLGNGWREKRPFSPVTFFAVVSTIIGLGGLFLATSFSEWLWLHWSLLKNFQFPWRFLDLPTFFLSLSAGYVLSRTSKKIAFRSWLLPLAMLCFFANAIPYLYPARRLDLPKRPSLTDVTQVQQIFQHYGLTAWGEYSAATVRQWPAGPPFVGADQHAPLSQKIILPEGVQLLAAKGDALAAVWRVTAERESTLTFWVHHFPGWQAVVDERPYSIQPDNLGRMTMTIPPGTHTIQLKWGRTPIRWVADSISLLALLLTAGAILQFRQTRDRQNSHIPATTHYSSVAPFTLLLLLGLLVLKTVWLDRYTSPWLIQPQADGSLEGLDRPAWQNFGDMVKVAGVQLDNESHRLTLYWQSQQFLDELLSVVITLTDPQGRPVSTIRHDTPGENVTITWQPGEWIRDVYQLPLSGPEPPFGYRAYVSVLAADGRLLPLVDVSAPEVTRVEVARPKLPPPPVVVPDTAVVLDTLFDGALKLSGVVLPPMVNRNEPFTLTLYWESKTAVVADYTVFIHLLDENGNFVAGNDAQPRQGTYPTSYWSPGETIVDPHPWQLDVPPGTYQVQIGLYQLETGTRLHTATGADAVVIGTLTVR